MKDDRLYDDCWRGSTCAILGGGPSLKNLDGAILRDWHKRKQNRKLIAVNCAILDYPEADAFFTEDERVIRLLHKQDAWKSTKAIKVFHALTPQFKANCLKLDPSLFVIERSREDKHWSRSLDSGLTMAASSGSGAINLAHILGVWQLYLLGFDCRSTTSMEQNYHDLYERAAFDRTGSQQYVSFRNDFEAWVAPHVGSMNPINLCDPEFPSAIRSWKKIDRDVYLTTEEEKEITGSNDWREARGKSVQSALRTDSGPRV